MSYVENKCLGSKVFKRDNPKVIILMKLDFKFLVFFHVLTFARKQNSRRFKKKKGSVYVAGGFRIII